jgi:tetratricopeptide (TPR) repeat protein
MKDDEKFIKNDDWYLTSDALNEAKKCNSSGIANYQIGKRDAAIADFTQAIKFCPVFAPAHNNRAVVHAVEGRVQEALADYTRAYELDPNNVQIAENYRCYYNKHGKKPTD